MNSELEAAIDLSESIPQNMTELDEWLRLRFKYVVGEPKAWYEKPNAWGNAERRVYVVMALLYKMPHRSTFASLEAWECYRAGAETKLVESFHQTFANLIMSSGVALPTFVERRRLGIDISDRVEFEKMPGFSNDGYNSSVGQRPQFCPLDYELDLVDNCWKRVTERSEILKLSVRFDIPECSPSLLDTAYGHTPQGGLLSMYNDTTPGVNGRVELMNQTITINTKGRYDLEPKDKQIGQPHELWVIQGSATGRVPSHVPVQVQINQRSTLKQIEAVREEQQRRMESTRGLDKALSYYQEKHDRELAYQNQPPVVYGSDPGHCHDIPGLERAAQQIKALTIPRGKLLGKGDIDLKGFMEKAFDEFYSKNDNAYVNFFKELATKGTAVMNVDGDQVDPYGNDINPLARLGSKHNPLTEAKYAKLIKDGYKHVSNKHQITAGPEFEARCNLRKTRLAREGKLGLFDDRQSHPPLAGFNKMTDI